MLPINPFKSSELLYHNFGLVYFQQQGVQLVFITTMFYIFKFYNYLYLMRTWQICLCWGFTAQSTQWGHVEHGQFT